VAAVKSFMAKPGQVPQQWWVVDAADKVVGRLATDIAMALMGKHRPTYTPHVDTGDFVIVVNAEKIAFSGRKWEQKTYRHYTGYPGQQVETATSLRDRHPDRVIREAVRRMLPKNRLGRHMLSKLKIYVGPDHPHQAQQPAPADWGKSLKA
jgi:large subunit ribosomal protein L13